MSNEISVYIIMALLWATFAARMSSQLDDRSGSTVLLTFLVNLILAPVAMLWAIVKVRCDLACVRREAAKAGLTDVGEAAHDLLSVCPMSPDMKLLLSLSGIKPEQCPALWKLAGDLDRRRRALAKALIEAGSLRGPGASDYLDAMTPTPRETAFRELRLIAWKQRSPQPDRGGVIVIELAQQGVVWAAKSGDRTALGVSALDAARGVLDPSTKVMPEPPAAAGT